MNQKHPNRLITELLKELNDKGISISKFAAQAGIPKDRVYKWMQENTNPKSSDAQKINEWLKGEISTKPSGNTKLEMGDLNLTVKDYLEKIEKHNAFLESLVQTNLTQLSATQLVILAQVKASLQWEAVVASGGDKKKQAAVLAEINKLVAEQLTGVSETDNSTVPHS